MAETDADPGEKGTKERVLNFFGLTGGQEEVLPPPQPSSRVVVSARPVSGPRAAVPLREDSAVVSEDSTSGIVPDDKIMAQLQTAMDETKPVALVQLTNLLRLYKSRGKFQGDMASQVEAALIALEAQNILSPQIFADIGKCTDALDREQAQFNDEVAGQESAGDQARADRVSSLDSQMDTNRQSIANMEAEIQRLSTANEELAAEKGRERSKTEQDRAEIARLRNVFKASIDSLRGHLTMIQKVVSANSQGGA